MKNLHDAVFMTLALELAAQGRGMTSPNPMVGAVVVTSKETVVGRGFHEHAGAPHAEINALRDAGKQAKGGTLYVTMEPCSTQGKTPPCVPSIIEADIARVVFGSVDPNPLNGNKAEPLLEAHGISVTGGIQREEAEKLNEAFFTFFKIGRPFVTVKAALSLDGKMATITGTSQWITNAKSRNFAHLLRTETDAILVGSNTVIRDNPLLTARDGEQKRQKQPYRVILDSRAAIPLHSKVLAPERASSTIVVVTSQAPRERIEKIKVTGADVITVNERKNRVELEHCLKKLAEKGIISVMIEGGSEVITSAFEERVVDKVCIFISPLIIGGKDAPSLVQGEGAHDIQHAIRLKEVEHRQLDGDILVTGYPEYKT